ncbi:MAG TPA: FeoB-associated Cys-rich membrane protein [Aquaticitalea sp.]|nr:FeoB-associated Cys-rich membrane protein [Aquaticitalea sp.]HNU60034.1 FeoB-associated Cys-rich membrane protein [Aquaticitalea sp.]
MDFQEVIVYVILGLAVAYLLKKFVFKPKKKNCGGGENCGCG